MLPSTIITLVALLTSPLAFAAPQAVDYQFEERALAEDDFEYLVAREGSPSAGPALLRRSPPPSPKTPNPPDVPDRPGRRGRRG